MSPYYTFTLTCTVTAPPGVVEPKTFTWRRTAASGGSCDSFTVVTESGTRQIANSNEDQPMSTSELTVTETTAAVWRYCCQASLLGVTGASDVVAITVTSECVIPTELSACFVVHATHTYPSSSSKQHNLS